MIRLLPLILLFALVGCEQIDTGNRGVKIHFGEVDEKAGSLPEGLYWYNPITTSIMELNCKLQRAEGEANTYTRDIQQADIKYVVNYGLEPEAAHTIYKTVGRDWYAQLVPQAIQGVMKQIIGQYDAVDLIEHRNKATEDIKKAIADSLRQRHVIIDRFEMINIQYQKEFERAVESKVVAVQKAIEEQNRTKQIQEQARQKIVTAQADAEAMRIKANALTQNPKLVSYEAVQRWNGILPSFMGSGTIPFLNLDMKN
jgi:regulator of protease activity HflC (stomatin/prohibitin superfamily)